MSLNPDPQPIYPQQPFVYIHNGSGCSQTFTSGYNGGSVWNIASDKKVEEGLFDEVENRLKGKSISPELENNIIKDVRAILSFIHNTFASRSDCLHLFFMQDYNGSKDCFHYIKGLPIMKFSLCEDLTVLFSSNWEGYPSVYEGWDSIPDNGKHNWKLHKTKSLLLIKSISKITVYEWGFEIIGDKGMILNALLGYVIDEKLNSTIVDNWQAPIKKELLDNEDFKKVIACWSKNEI